MTKQAITLNESGFAGRNGLITDAYRQGAARIIEACESKGINVVRVCFVDQHGLLRGKSFVVSALKSVFESGVNMTSTLLLKDTSNTTVFPVWQTDIGFGAGQLTGASDIMMVADPDTFRILPWAPGDAWLFADLYDTKGKPLSISSRGILKSALSKLHDQGLELITGLEVEFHVLQVVDQRLSLSDAGRPGRPPETELVSHGYQYLSDDRYDCLRDVFELVRQNSIGLGLPIRSLETEFGPSQCEVTFDPAGALEHADNMIMFRNMVKQVCRAQGLHATFMCRPRFADAMASGWHLHQSVVDKNTGENLFIPKGGEYLSPLGQQWVAGLLKHATESCLFSTPTVNGYKRYRDFALAPTQVQWGRDNRGTMIRSLGMVEDPASRIENRIGEPTANPYLYVASQVLSGLDGINQKLVAPAPTETPYGGDGESLPKSLVDAIGAFRTSRFYRDQLGDGFVDYLSTIKQAEWDRYLGTVSEWEEREYFSIF